MLFESIIQSHISLYDIWHGYIVINKVQFFSKKDMTYFQFRHFRGICQQSLKQSHKLHGICKPKTWIKLFLASKWFFNMAKGVNSQRISIISKSAFEMFYFRAKCRFTHYSSLNGCDCTENSDINGL